MPVIDWIGKKEVLGAVRGAVRLLRGVCGLSAGDDEAGNLLVQGDNLEALRALLPHYGGRVKCVYIDPPYNTGKEGWKYNDRVDSPQIRNWLGNTVGDEASDLCRHDKWLCMMHPRLRLLRKFLREDGVIFVSVDDYEQHRLRMLMDEIFGASNLVASLIWRKKAGGGQDSEYFAREHEYVLAYRKSEKFAMTFRKTSIRASDFPKMKNGRKCKFIKLEKWGSNAYRVDRPTMYYPIKNPDGKDFYPQAPDGREGNWRTRPLDLDKHHIHWDKGGRNSGRWTPYEVKYYDEVGDKLKVVKDRTIFYDLATTTDATNEQKDVFGEKIFDNSKPLELLLRLIFLSTGKKDIIMDSFAGSGTTAHAVLRLNKEDGGDRKFILVEMDEDIARNIAAKRIQKAVKGYKSNGIVAAPLGGGFRFCTLGPPLFDDNGHINKEVRFADLAAHVFFSETRRPIPKRATTPLLGVCEDSAIYLLYNGIMGDKSKNGGNVLTPSVLRRLPAPADKTARRIVFGEACLLSKEQLAKNNIIFRQIPYQIRMR